MVDYPIDVDGDILTKRSTDLYFNQYFPHSLFLLAFGGIIIKYLFIAFSGRIGKEVEYVIHGVEEASNHLIQRLKPDEIYDGLWSITMKKVDSQVKTSLGEHEKPLRKTDPQQFVMFDGVFNGAFNEFEVRNTLKEDSCSSSSDKDRRNFAMFEKYLSARKVRYSIIKQIIATRLGIIATVGGACFLIYKFFAEEIFSYDGRSLSNSFQCKLPSQYWQVELDMIFIPVGTLELT